MPGRSRTTLLVLAGTLCLGHAEAAPDSARQFRVPLPTGWKTARRLILVLEDMTTPRGQALIIKVQTRASAADVTLGSFGVLAEAEGAAGTRRHPAFRVDVTRSLHRWASRNDGKSVLDLHLVPEDGKGNALRELEWAVGAVRMESR